MIAQSLKLEAQSEKPIFGDLNQMMIIFPVFDNTISGDEDEAVFTT
ncbi:hypothetical protein [uncultured Ruminococcus sp.]|nr:hypothetical protein [uncultured Ruminococcus sp.]